MNWDGKRLEILIKKTGISISSTAKILNISESAIRKYINCRENPSFNMIEKMADYFAVPLDYLCGRCSLEDAQHMLDNYTRCFNSIKHGTYEQYLMGKIRTKNFDTDKYEEPYPYNLVHAIFGEANWILTKENLKAIKYGLSQIKNRDREIIEVYFRDHLTYDNIGSMYDIGKVRVGQIIERGLRTLRSPIIKDGIRKGAYTESDIIRLNAKLDNREKTLDAREEELKRFEKELSERMRKMNEESTTIETTPITDNTVIQDLNLSVRSYNCLLRTHIKTLTDTINALNNGHILKARSLGPKSLYEIIDKVNEITGSNYTEEIVITNARSNGVSNNYTKKFMKGKNYDDI